jgi:hypothetical protein
MMPESEQLLLLVRGLGSAVKEDREGAESMYERDWVPRPALLFPSLLEVIANGSDSIVLVDSFPISC